MAEALKVLEWAGVLAWQHRIARIQVRERDLFGRWASRWRVTRDQDDSTYRVQAPVDPDSPLERALQHLGSVIEVRLLANGSGGQVLAI